MKPTLELQEIVSALGIDPFRFLAWQEQELALKEQQHTPIEEQKDASSMYGLVV
ncbi:hypothetical protein ACFPES_32905 [Paenibacillus sp. GCM10023248]|uniref:hypothetical protein n=1 Tax=Bacillales TaxID=1385 RepID=UPI002379CEE5|nr:MULTISPECIES: hypothetical protein [Bacillales]MDD9271840.1 hypothetical protein [Paenibacillus sp. MAHUQ-63]MDR6883438.1 hypothetical protein [Bacillus sp. 3255]